MWGQAVTWVLGFLAIAVSAGWLAGRRTRSLRMIKAEADLLPNMPSGAARTALEAHIAESVTTYLRQREKQDRQQMVRLVLIVVQVIGLGFLMTAEFNGAGMTADWTEAPEWAKWCAISGVTLLGGPVMWEMVLVARELKVDRGEAKIRRPRAGRSERQP